MNKILAAAFALCIINPALAVDSDAVIGGALGGGVGAAVGSELGGREGAIIGGALGAAVGVAVTADDEKPSARPARTIYVERPAPRYRHTHRYRHNPPGHARHRKKHKWK